MPNPEGRECRGVTILATKKQSTSNPYKVLYWMGAGVLLLFVGIGALVWLMPKPNVQPRDPARAVVWLHDEAQQTNLLVVLVESRSRSTLTALPLPASFKLDGTSHDMGAKLRADGGREARKAVAAALGREMHNRLIAPTGAIVKLIDAAKGVDLEGKRMSGSEAIQWLMAPPSETEKANRATAVFLALVQAATYRGVDMGMSEGLALARQIDTDFDLMDLPTVLGRWAGHTTTVAQVAAADGTVDRAKLEAALLPDPAPAPSK